jgi:hypothetical protein
MLLLRPPDGSAVRKHNPRVALLRLRHQEHVATVAPLLREALPLPGGRRREILQLSLPRRRSKLFLGECRGLRRQSFRACGALGMACVVKVPQRLKPLQIRRGNAALKRCSTHSGMRHCPRLRTDAAPHAEPSFARLGGRGVRPYVGRGDFIVRSILPVSARANRSRSGATGLLPAAAGGVLLSLKLRWRCRCRSGKEWR